MLLLWLRDIDVSVINNIVVGFIIFDCRLNNYMPMSIVSKAKKGLSEMKITVTNVWANNSEKYGHITEEERADLVKLVEKADSWIEEKAEAQLKVSSNHC